MKLWLLKPKDDNYVAWNPWYDKAFGFVVRAETEERARQLANDKGGDEVGKISNTTYRTGGDPWLDPKQSTCEELTTDGDEEVVLEDYASA